MSVESGAEKDDDALVAEYALGLLSDAERQEFEQRLLNDARLRADLTFWQSNLSTIADEISPVEAPHLYKSIANRLFETESQPNVLARVWADLAFWRAFAFGAVAIFAVALFVILAPLSSTPEQADRWVASLQADESDARFVAIYDDADQQVWISGLSGAPVSDQDYELWLIAPEDAPISLGVVPVAGTQQIGLADALAQKVGDGAVFAVTLEPLGGAPEGIPTGPVVAAGEVFRMQAAQVQSS